jgi:TonB family protein
MIPLTARLAHGQLNATMPAPHAFRRTACALALCCGLWGTVVLGQSTLEHARDLYLSADYDQALALLGQLRAESQAQKTEIAAYQVFCLMALGRLPEATRAIEAIVAADPFYQPPDTIASPRIRSVFRDTRRAALPAVAQRDYSAAKAAFDRKDPASTAMFERVLTLLRDPDLDTPASADLRVLADGFRELSRTFSTPKPVEPTPAAVATAPETPRQAPPTTPQPPASQAGPPPAEPGSLTPAREGDPGVTPPLAIAQPMPPWTPPSRGLERQQQFNGILELLIDERGVVREATLRKSVHPQYDDELLRAARTWRFRPASKDGKPTPYLKIVQISLRPAGR